MKHQVNTGISGEFSIRVLRADGSVKLELPMQKNLLTDNGLKYWLNVSNINGGTMVNNNGETSNRYADNCFSMCLLGTGSVLPQYSNNKLTSLYCGQNNKKDHTVLSPEYPTESLHPNYVKLSQRCTFQYNDIDNQNITELGLAIAPNVNVYTTTSSNIEDVRKNTVRHSYQLLTHALIRDTSGTPIAVTVLKDEILEVTYQINLYVDIRRQTGEFTLDIEKLGNTTTETFEYILQPYKCRSNDIEHPLWINQHNLTSWGAKDGANESFSFDSPAVTGMTYESVSSMDDVVVTRAKYENYSSSDYISPTSTLHMTWQNLEASFETKQRRFKLITGIYSHVFDNGIREYRFIVTGNYYTSTEVFRNLVVVRNKKDGTGIPKTDKQKWELEIGFKVDRWED